MNIPVNDENQWLKDADIWTQNGTTVGFYLITFISFYYMLVPLSILIKLSYVSQLRFKTVTRCACFPYFLY